MKIKKGDKVIIITGDDSGKIGEIMRVFPSLGKVIVKDVNVVKRHKRSSNEKSGMGGIVSFEKAVDVSNVMYYDISDKKFSRLGVKVVNGKKYRFIKKSNKLV